MKDSIKDIETILLELEKKDLRYYGLTVSDTSAHDEEVCDVINRFGMPVI